MTSRDPATGPDLTGRHPVRCSGKVKSTGGQCRLNAIPGGTVCAARHGGKAPQIAAAAERRIREASLLAAVETYGLPRDVAPEAALLEEVARTAGHIEWLEAKIRSLDPEALVWGMTKTENKGATEFEGVDVTEAAGISVWLDLYLRERAHYVKVCKTAIDCNLLERGMAIAESVAGTLVTVIRLILSDLGQDPTSDRAVEVMGRRLREIEGSTA